MLVRKKLWAWRHLKWNIRSSAYKRGHYSGRMFIAYANEYGITSGIALRWADDMGERDLKEFYRGFGNALKGE